MISYLKLPEDGLLPPFQHGAVLFLVRIAVVSGSKRNQRVFPHRDCGVVPKDMLDRCFFDSLAQG